MLIKKFSIRKLHGYKDVEIEFTDKAKIIVAENGAGKTTIINALNAILTCRFKRLSAINFESMKVVFCNEDEVEISKESLNDSIGSGEDIADKLASESGSSTDEIIKFVLNEYKQKDRSSIQSSTFFRAIYLNSPHSSEIVFDRLDEIQNALESEDGVLNLAKETIRKNLNNIEVVFLPTYRRVELPITRPSKSKRRVGGIGAIPPRNNGQLDAKYFGMNFGLSDVEDRLNELADVVERRSNFEYRQVSARMVKELLRGQITIAEAEQYPMPDLHALQMFFSRVENASVLENMDNLKRYYDSSVLDTTQHIFLRYFLGQLSQVIDQTRAIEEMLRSFVDVCNQYLKMSSDEKSLAYVPESMKVEVRNSWTDTEVSMDALSSGEKQVISLLSKLYLESNNKIVLIDEPELSLSLDWQKRILLDVLRPSSVIQLLAITHSPFVFDNELEKYAGPFNVVRSGTG